MSTNLYIDGKHIGKRSMAGMYCWGCHVTLCKDGEEGVHSGRSDWFDKCQQCGTEPTGQERAPFVGVQGVCSFSWAMKPDHFAREKGQITDEYGRAYTRDKFETALLYCPIRYYGSIGVDFS